MLISESKWWPYSRPGWCRISRYQISVPGMIVTIKHLDCAMVKTYLIRHVRSEYNVKIMGGPCVSVLSGRLVQAWGGWGVNLAAARQHSRKNHALLGRLLLLKKGWPHPSVCYKSRQITGIMTYQVAREKKKKLQQQQWKGTINTTAVVILIFVPPDHNNEFINHYRVSVPTIVCMTLDGYFRDRWSMS